jgi:amidophosphoribosyltransferase
VKLVADGCIFQSTSDTEVILHLVARSKRRASSNASSTRCARHRRRLCARRLTNKKLIGARDPLGIRPLVLGESDGADDPASETCALDMIGAKFVRDIENGEVVVIAPRTASRASSPSPPRGAALHLRIHLFLAAGLHRRRPQRL